MSGKNICIQQPCIIDGEQYLTLGDNIHIGRGTEIMADGGISIGNNVVIAYQCVLWSIDHRYEGDSLPYDKARIRRPIVIHDNVWIGRNRKSIGSDSIDSAVINCYSASILANKGDATEWQLLKQYPF